MKSRMSSPLPIFILLGLALMAMIGMMVLESSSTAAAVEVNNTTRDPLPLAVYTSDSVVVYGLVVLLVLIALYFVLRFFT